MAVKSLEDTENFDKPWYAKEKVRRRAKVFKRNKILEPLRAYIT
jgi:hypothetical protein